MGPYVETSESATPTLLVLPQEPNLVRTTLCGVDTSSYGLTAIPRVQPGEPVAGNPLGGFCEGGRAQERCSRPVPTHRKCRPAGDRGPPSFRLSPQRNTGPSGTRAKQHKEVSFLSETTTDEHRLKMFCELRSFKFS